MEREAVCGRGGEEGGWACGGRSGRRGRGGRDDAMAWRELTSRFLSVAPWSTSLMHWRMWSVEIFAMVLVTCEQDVSRGGG